MLKLLIWKQFYQTFRTYFVDNKTSKAKSKPKIIGMFILFVFVMLGLCGMFFMFAQSVLPLLDTNVSWLYYSFFGLLTLGLGIFASLFNTTSTIYNAKDNDLLLSMPIKPEYVLISRITSIAGLCFVYSATIWLPICIAAFLYKGFNLVNCIFEIVLLFAIVALACVISCIAGYVVAMIQNKTKNKSIVTVFVSIVFLGAYYYICIRFSDFINDMIANADIIASGVTKYGNFIYQLGIGANGNVLGFIIFVSICLVLSIACYIVLKKNFTSVVAKLNNVAVSNSKVVYKSSNKISNILLKKEFKRFTSSSVYMLNCGLGSIFVIAVAVVVIFKAKDVLPLLELIQTEMPDVLSFVPLAIIGVVCSMISINTSTVPSIALEGKSLWVIKSLPVNTVDVLFAKKQMQVLINGIPAAIASGIISYVLKFDFSTSVYIVTLVIMFVLVQSSIGIILGLVNPNFNWTNETQPVKQSIYILVEMLVCWILLVLMIGGYYFLKDKMLVLEYMQYVLILLMIMEILLRRTLRSWGVSKFESF